MPTKTFTRCALNQYALFAASLIMLLAPSSAVAQTPGKLQSLVNDAAAQFKMAYRQNPEEHRARYEQLSRALATWRAAPRSEENDRLLTDWLRSAIRHSMPGSREFLPTLPEFKRPTEVKAPAQTPAADKRTGDPFTDDPPGAVE